MKRKIYYTIDTLVRTNADYEKALDKLKKYDWDDEFTAKDAGLSGATCTGLVSLGFLKIIRTESAWFQLNEDTMKKYNRNVYALGQNFDKINGIFTVVKERKVDKIEARIERLKKALALAYKDLDELS